MRCLACGTTLLALAALVAVAAAEDKKKASEIVINISKPGAKAKYIKEGDTEQKDVTVLIGESVKWVNKGNKTHTATSTHMVKVNNKEKPLFDTGELDVDKSATILFDEQKYKDAGGKNGDPVPLEYICTVHGGGNMKSKLILKPAEKKKEEAKEK